MKNLSFITLFFLFSSCSTPLMEEATQIKLISIEQKSEKNADFKKNHPNGYKLMKQMNFSGPDIDKMANYKDTDGLEVSAACGQLAAKSQERLFKKPDRSCLLYTSDAADE